MSCMRQNFRLFHVSNLSVRNFRIFLLMYTGSSRAGRVTLQEGGRRAERRDGRPAAAADTAEVSERQTVPEVTPAGRSDVL